MSSIPIKDSRITDSLSWWPFASSSVLCSQCPQPSDAWFSISVHAFCNEFCWSSITSYLKVMCSLGQRWTILRYLNLFLVISEVKCQLWMTTNRKIYCLWDIVVWGFSPVPKLMVLEQMVHKALQLVQFENDIWNADAICVSD